MTLNLFFITVTIQKAKQSVKQIESDLLVKQVNEEISNRRSNYYQY